MKQKILCTVMIVVSLFACKNKGLDIKPPKNYFVDDSLTSVDMKWISTANLLYTNWLNYYVYQVTPFEL